MGGWVGGWRLRMAAWNDITSLQESVTFFTFASVLVGVGECVSSGHVVTACACRVPNPLLSS